MTPGIRPYARCQRVDRSEVAAAHPTMAKSSATTPTPHDSHKLLPVLPAEGGLPSLLANFSKLPSIVLSSLKQVSLPGQVLGVFVTHYLSL